MKKTIEDKKTKRGTGKKSTTTGGGSRSARGGTTKKNKDISKFRDKIDKIDNELLDLLNERAELAIKIGHAKASSNMSFYSPKRERQIFERLSKRNPGPFPNDALRAVFREIISVFA